MEQRSGSQLLLSFILLGVFCSQVLAYSAMRAGILQMILLEKDKFDLSRALNINTRHADGLFTSAYSKLLGEQSARRYLESLIGKRVGDNNPIDEQEPVKRHIDAVFTSLYGRARTRQKLANYVRAVLAENERQERLKKARMSATTDLPEIAPSENEDVSAVEIELLNDLALNL
ncbi:VIP peptides [Tiliqua scincoides]|uniref:VIP peptides n=1 Tax=Tiliqua scincoides TaxID=71010 RepID=UPI003462D227